MNFAEMDRRTFLKIMGLSGSGLVLPLAGCGNATLEDGVEEVSAYVDPEEFAIPGDEVWYATTCRQCPAGCGVHGRVREGRVRKLEGNPHSPVNLGRLCPMGQAGLQSHYHPDRLNTPLLRQNGELKAISWQQAQQHLAKLISQSNKAKGKNFALLSGQVSGHLAVLMDALREQLGKSQHYVYEPLSTAASRAVHQEQLGMAMPALHLDKAKLVVSFGADFLGPWLSPVHLATQYGNLRDAPRGTLIQVESKMSLSGANADWWLSIRPGTESWLMLAVAKLLASDPERAKRLSKDVRESLADYDVASVSKKTDVSEEDIARLADALASHQPSLVLVGGQAEANIQGSQAVAAGLLLNHLLGNIGKTLNAGHRLSLQQLGDRPASASLENFIRQLPSLDTLFIYDTNPLYSAPAFYGLQQKFGQIKNKVFFGTVLNETAEAADLVIPIRSAMEDWGTAVPAYAADNSVLQIQQPVMRPLYPELPGMGDQLLTLLQQLNPDVYGQWENFYSYLRHAVQLLRKQAEQVATSKPWRLPPLLTPPALAPQQPEQMLPAAEMDRLFWETTLAKGVLPLPAKRRALHLNLQPVKPVPEAENTEFPYYLLPTPRLGLYDGRHADLPWLQELPDQLSTVVWDSWAELHPDTAARLNLKEGDVIEITSSQGNLQVKVVLFAGMHSDAVAVPLGQGHHVGRYAKGVGVNPFMILAPQFDANTSELALYGTRVSIRKTEQHETVVKQAPTDSQHKRRLVRTISSKTIKATEG